MESRHSAQSQRVSGGVHTENRGRFFMAASIGLKPDYGAGDLIEQPAV
jgi:hypothetical protein